MNTPHAPATSTDDPATRGVPMVASTKVVYESGRELRTGVS
jgi:hypothetical protein